MAGETSVVFGEPILAGDLITVEKRLADMYEKEGRSGPLVFVEMEFTFTNQHGELVARENFTRIYR
jgi:hydroxyacyl-ACP dehydratase HTD2-like protein with hotdog domain